MATRTPPAPEVDEPLGLPAKLGRTLAVVVGLAMAAFWAWTFVSQVNPDVPGSLRRANPDELDDQAYVERSEARCQQLRSDLQRLTPAEKTTSAAERADVLDEANVLVSAMVDDLEADAPTEGDDATSVAGWIADWRVYLADRADYADRLRVDADAKLLVSENPDLGDSVDKTIEIFADDANDMPACQTPGDVG